MYSLSLSLSRRDSFITHRAFCDALAEETSRSMPPQTAPNNLIHGFHLPLKQETLNFSLPPWLSPDSSSVPGPFQEAGQAFLPAPSLMSATALLQKAAAMGVTMSGNNGKTMAYNQPSDHHLHHHRGDDDPMAGGGGPRPPHQQHHVGAPGFCATTSTAGGLPSRDEYVHGLAAYGTGKLDSLTGGCMEGGGGSNSMQENMAMAAAAAAAASTSGYHGFDDSFNGIFNSKRNLQSFQQDAHFMAGLRKEGGASASAAGGGGGGDGMARDFLGLRAFPHRDFSNMAGLDQMGSSSTPFDHQNQAPWQS